MLDHLQRLPSDPILGLAAECRADPNPHKVDLTIGIYMDEQGVCPVFEAVQRAQRALRGEAELLTRFVHALARCLRLPQTGDGEEVSR